MAGTQGRNFFAQIIVLGLLFSSQLTPEQMESEGIGTTDRKKTKVAELPKAPKILQLSRS